LRPITLHHQRKATKSALRSRKTSSLAAAKATEEEEE